MLALQTLLLMTLAGNAQVASSQRQPELWELRTSSLPRSTTEWVGLFRRAIIPLPCFLFSDARTPLSPSDQILIPGLADLSRAEVVRKDEPLEMGAVLQQIGRPDLLDRYVQAERIRRWAELALVLPGHALAGLGMMTGGVLALAGLAQLLWALGAFDNPQVSFPQKDSDAFRKARPGYLGFVLGAPLAVLGGVTMLILTQPLVTAAWDAAQSSTEHISGGTLWPASLAAKVVVAQNCREQPSDDCPPPAPGFVAE